MSVALVTGASRNIGRAVALALADGGHDVVVHAVRSVDAAEAVAGEVRARGRQAWVALADVSNPDAVGGLLAGVEASAGRVSVLVNNAAVRTERPFLALEAEEWRRILGVVLDGAYLCSRAFLPGMVQDGSGRIINIIGVRGEEGAPGRAHVVAAKSGLIGLTRALAREFGPEGITVNAVSPGTIETDRDREDPARLERRAQVRVLPRPGQPDDVGAAVAFLASESAGFITGQVIGVNGGERMA